jgi:hypothetical protein
MRISGLKRELLWGIAATVWPCLAQEAAAPQLAVNLNGGAEAQVTRGWPALVQAAVLHPDIASPTDSGPFTIGINNGPWPGAIRLNVIDSNGKDQIWAFHAGVPTADTVTVTKDIPAEVYLWLTPDDTKSLNLGTYALTAVLDTRTNSGPGMWTDVIQSEAISITVRDEPAPLQPDDAAEKDLLLATYTYVAGDAEAALNYVNQLLSDQPDHIQALEMKGSLLAETGQFADALEALDAAVRQFVAQNPNPEELPRLLYSRHAALMNQVISTDSAGQTSVSNRENR